MNAASPDKQKLFHLFQMVVQASTLVWTWPVGYLRAMPTILSIGPYRFFFYSSDRGEPMHVQVERDDKVAKLWLEPLRMQEAGGFSDTEINRIRKLTEDNLELLRRSWNEYFNG